MKNTFKLTTVMLFIVFGTTLFAQSFNFNGGFTMSKIRGENDISDSYSGPYYDGTYSETNKMKFLGGFNASVGYEFRLNNRLSLQTGFKFQTAGYKLVEEYSYTTSFETYKKKSVEKYNRNYLHLPVVLNTAILTGDIRVYLRTGLFIGMMTGEKHSIRSEFESSIDGNGSSEHSQSGGVSYYEMGDRLTAGFIAGVGVEYKGFYFESNYDLGAVQLSDFKNKIYFENIGFSLGYKIKYNKEEKEE